MLPRFFQNATRKPVIIAAFAGDAVSSTTIDAEEISRAMENCGIHFMFRKLACRARMAKRLALASLCLAEKLFRAPNWLSLAPRMRWLARQVYFDSSRQKKWRNC